MLRWSRATAVLCSLGVLLAGCRPGDASPRERETAYVCPPCAPHDTLTFEHDGACPVCGMELTEKPDTAPTADLHLHEGSGNFVMPGGPGHRKKLVTVYYHRPESFTPRSPVLIVVPGAGRDAWEYRDAWIEAAGQHGVLVLAPRYPEPAYPFGAYHMGGLMEAANVGEAARFVEGSAEVFLEEEALTYDVNRRPEEWIFEDLDRLFELAAEAVGSERLRYDVFGHSAGGQLLHRSVLFHPHLNARRIVAANSGFYTLPDPDAELPFGLKGTPVEGEDLRASLRQPLVLLLGEEDDHAEAGGTFLRSPSADRQGPGRLQRGRHFYEAGRKRAEELGAEFEWEIQVVPGVGHDHQGMSRAAARRLYGSDGAGRAEAQRRSPGRP